MRAQFVTLSISDRRRTRGTARYCTVHVHRSMDTVKNVVIVSCAAIGQFVYMCNLRAAHLHALYILHMYGVLCRMSIFQRAGSSWCLHVCHCYGFVVV